MKKLSCFLFIFSISMCLVFALGEYDRPILPNLRPVSDYGASGAMFCGTTKNITIYEVNNNRWQTYANSNMKPKLMELEKLSKNQDSLVRNALNRFDLKVGEIYSVLFSEYNIFLLSNLDFLPLCAVTVEITAVNSDGSCGYSWLGFYFYGERQ